MKYDKERKDQSGEVVRAKATEAAQQISRELLETLRKLLAYEKTYTCDRSILCKSKTHTKDCSGRTLAVTTYIRLLRKA